MYGVQRVRRLTWLTLLISWGCGSIEADLVDPLDRGKAEQSTGLTRSVVGITNGLTESGSGVIIGKNRVLTAGHMLRDEGLLDVRLANGSVHAIVDYLHDPKFDWEGNDEKRYDSAIAVVEGSFADEMIAPLAKRWPKPGDPVFHLGYGYHPKDGDNDWQLRRADGCFKEFLPKLGLKWVTPDRRQICKGDSGGPLFFDDGSGPGVVGVLSSNLAMPWDLFTPCRGRTAYSAPVIGAGVDFNRLLDQREAELSRLGMLAGMRTKQVRKSRIVCDGEDKAKTPYLAIGLALKYFPADEVFVELRGPGWTEQPELYLVTHSTATYDWDRRGFTAVQVDPLPAHRCHKNRVTQSWLCHFDDVFPGEERLLLIKRSSGCGPISTWMWQLDSAR
ncbi:MAG: trypsin-like serine protease [Deltaproteobacteria bacterium]|nr:trypsin-like serine protease [Deltaproteobacteria bacterium]